MGCQSTSKKNQATSLPDQMDSLLNSIADFSGVVLLADQGEAIYCKAFGVRDFESKVPVQVDDIFELASVSKQFTATTILILKEEGKISIDDPIDKFLPDVPYSGITIRHLLTHTSGLPDYQAVMDEHWDKSKVATNKDIIEYLIKFKPPILFEPGEKYVYSNTGYVLLGSITEKVSGKDFVQFCADRIFTPLNMSSTAIRSNEEKLNMPNFALGHIFVSEKNRFIRADSFPSSDYTIWLGGRKGPGRVSSTAKDVLKWDNALYTEQLIAKSSLDEAFTPQVLIDGSKSNYGFGWMLIPESPAGRVVWHNGDNPGYKTIIVRYLDKRKTLVMLNNNYHEKIEAVREGVDELISKQPDL